MFFVFFAVIDSRDIHDNIENRFFFIYFILRTRCSKSFLGFESSFIDVALLVARSKYHTRRFSTVLATLRIGKNYDSHLITKTDLSLIIRFTSNKIYRVVLIIKTTF